MNGYGSRALAEIDVELKEAVCDAFVNTIVGRVSGIDDEGRVVSGRSPRRSIVSGQLIPRFDVRGEDETSDIRIAASASTSCSIILRPGRLSLRPATQSMSVCSRPGLTCTRRGPLDVDFRLNVDVHHQIEDDIKAHRLAAFTSRGSTSQTGEAWTKPTTTGSRTACGQIQEEIRVQAYAQRGICLFLGISLRKRKADAPDSRARERPEYARPARLAAIACEPVPERRTGDPASPS